MCILIIDTIILVFLIQLVTGQLGNDNVDWGRPLIIAVLAGLAALAFYISIASVIEDLPLALVFVTLAGGYVVLGIGVLIGCLTIMGMDGKKSLIVGGSFAVIKLVFFVISLIIVALS